MTHQESNRILKTLRDWEDNHPDVNLDVYLNPLDEVDEQLWNHACTIAPPSFECFGVIQMCDCDDHRDGVAFYMTFAKYGDHYYYMGSLPEMTYIN